MKKQITILFVAIMWFHFALTQNNLTMLHHTGVVTAYSGTTGFVDAYNAASNGDTIYLGGGIFTTPTSYAKGLVIFGAGINIDSSFVTGTTTFTGTLNIYEGADNSHIEGIIMTVSFYNIDIDNITFNYCKFNNIIYSGTYTPGTTCDNHLYIRCHLTATANFNCTNFLLLKNCLIASQIQSIHENGVIDQCVVTYPAGGAFYQPLYLVSNSVISNTKFSNSNIYYYSNITNGTNNLFTHNAFNLIYSDVSNAHVGNYYGIVDNTFFVGDPDADGKYDYHLQTPASYIGTDGEQICLYGGEFVWKDGSMPGNPHIAFENIGSTSNEDGTLDVDIKVNAQDN